MTDVRKIHVDWYAQHPPRFNGGPQLAYQGDHLSNMVVFDRAPELSNYYLLVEMKTDDAGPVVTLPEIRLEGPYWVIPNYYTQICQKITYQVCCKTESGDFERHSAKFEGTILPVIKHNGEPIDQSPMFDPYIDILDKRVSELILDADVKEIDSELKSDSGNPVQNRVIKAKIDEIDENATALNGRLGEVKADLSEVATFDGGDYLSNKTAIEKWFIDPFTGVGRTLDDFFSFSDIDVTNARGKRLYVYSSKLYSEYNVCRSLAFYDDNGDYITGYGGSGRYALSGFPVPTNAKTVGITFIYETTTGQVKPSLYWASDNVYKDTTVSIKPNVMIPEAFSNNVRMPCINFQFDDGVANDAAIVNIFKDHGLVCGFALISNITLENVSRYLGYQHDGFEILCHADSGTGMNDPSIAPDTIEGRLTYAKTTLENYGFRIKGFVTPNSTMANVFKPILRKYFQWAETVYFGAYTGTGQPYMKPVNGIYNGWRISLQSTTLANQKAAVDAAIANNGCLTFYGHAANLDTTDNLTTANLEALLTYIADKVSNNEVIVGAPSEVILNYFSVRNDDVSDGWIDVTATEAGLDSRFIINKWSMSYNIKLGLLFFSIRVAPSEDVSGQIQLFTFPKSVVENQLVPNESGRIAFPYNGKLLINGSSTWVQGVNYRFSGMLKLV